MSATSVQNLSSNTTSIKVLFDYINASPATRTASIAVNGGAPVVISFLVTGTDWVNSNQANYAVKLSGFTPGSQNTLVIGGTDGYVPDISRIGIPVTSITWLQEDTGKLAGTAVVQPCKGCYNGKNVGYIGN